MRITKTIVFSAILLIQSQVFGASPSALEERIAKEEQFKEQGLFVLPYRPNYLMPMSYNANPNGDPFPNQPLQEVETKFQVSVKVPMTETLFDFPVQSYLAYTQVSYWQTYNHHDSAFFRETDYEPELFLQFPRTHKIGTVTNRYNRLGFDHQSNGQPDQTSRSWNRLYAEFVFDQGPGMVSIRPWFRIPGPDDHDTNPGMAKYYGYGELRGAMKFLGRHEASFMFRNNLRVPENKGAIELEWAFPLIRSMKGFVQYFNGYGESLIDYNVPVSRTSVGVSFSGWL